jgi:hypothetical protein
MRLTILVLFALTLLIGCPQQATSPTFVQVPDTEVCPTMCAHFRELKCPEGDDYYDNDKPGPKGVPNAKCEEFCQRQQTNGVYENPRCLSKVPSCALIEDWRKKDCSVDGGP